MLLKVYRIGPARQRVLKGYAVAGAQAPNVVKRVVEAWASQRGTSSRSQASLCVDNSQPTALWLDTGAVWLHTVSARTAVFSSLALSAQDLARAVASAGGELVPNAVRASPTQRWQDVSCGDDHILETADDVEREVCCNLIRSHSPTLIALSARAGVSPQGLERLASRRLSMSARHYAARYLASVSAAHLERVVRELRREEAISRIDLLDVSPVGRVAGELLGPQVRCFDGQSLIGTTKAHAILCQALLLRARRLVREGRRVGAARQRMVELNRARAISYGLLARFEEDQGKPDVRTARSSGPKRQDISGVDAAFSLIFDLRKELQILEVDYDEIASLVLGLSLRQIGVAGARNENDLLRGALTRKLTGWPDLRSVFDTWRSAEISGVDPLNDYNQTHFPEAAAQVRSWWNVVLREKDDRPKPNALAHHGARSISAAPSQPRHGQKHAHDASRHAAPRSDPSRAAAERLLEELIGAGDALSNDRRLEILASFSAAAGPNVGVALSILGREKAKAARDLLRPGRERQYGFRPSGSNWSLPSLERALADASETGLALIFCEVDETGLEEAAANLDALRKTPPAGVQLYLFQRAKFQVGGKARGRLEALVARCDLGGQT